MNPTSAQKPGHSEGRTSNVLRLPVPESDAALAMCLRSDPERGKALLFERYSVDVERVLCRILGPDRELPDLLHDVFIAAITGISTLRDNNALRSWVTGIAVNKARRLIRRRKLQRLVQFISPNDLPEFAGSIASPEISDALYHTYEIMGRLPTEERICFTLRQIDGMELSAIAQVTHVSLATVKRRLGRAQRRFVQLARENDTLVEWLERGTLDR
jgi:RNA polymerase sigma-70 factor (ECF subfamily)